MAKQLEVQPASGPVEATVRQHVEIEIYVADDSYARAYNIDSVEAPDPTVHMEFGTYGADHVRLSIPRSKLEGLLDQFTAERTQQAAEAAKRREERARKKAAKKD